MSRRELLHVARQMDGLDWHAIAEQMVDAEDLAASEYLAPRPERILAVERVLRTVLAAEIRQRRAPIAAQDWHPIDSAPKEVGRQLLGWFPLPAQSANIYVMHWDAASYATRPRPHWGVYGWIWGMVALRTHQPTHWQPLPPAPPEPPQ